MCCALAFPAAVAKPMGIKLGQGAALSVSWRLWGRQIRLHGMGAPISRRAKPLPRRRHPLHYQLWRRRSKAPIPRRASAERRNCDEKDILDPPLGDRNHICWIGHSPAHSCSRSPWSVNGFAVASLRRPRCPRGRNSIISLTRWERSVCGATICRKVPVLQPVHGRIHW
jgi:hypothetical protein